MARQKEVGLHYFSLDCDIFSAKSDLKPLLQRFKSDGLALYMHILCDVYSTGYYYRPNNYEDYLYALADDCGITVNKVQLILTFMQDRSLLDANCLDKDTVFTSHGIQKRYVEAMKGRKRSVAEIKGEYWLLTPEEEEKLDTFYKGDLKANKSEKNADKSEKYSIKEIKENKIKDYNTHNARTRDEDSLHSEEEELKELTSSKTEDFQKQFDEFVGRWGIAIDSNSPFIRDFDFGKLNAAYERSAKFLQSDPLPKFLSWIVKNYSSIIKGKYNDHDKKEKKYNDPPGAIRSRKTGGILHSSYDPYAIPWEGDGGMHIVRAGEGGDDE